ncbi:MAG: 30S ribosomal protein S17 [Candidatus Marinimicrobia bacterium]|nr:30S ribosomal protein S17 [Candidatus Neomarinimicrobiota bacterium]MAR29370.1 30S ribosomal protein S17 [Candidatus Neomarinimicrobiota bacterium]
MGDKRQLVGEVVSTKMKNTIVVRVNRKFPHKTYKKLITRSKKYYAHDFDESCGIGDTVRIIESKPLSKLKRWRVIGIEKKAVN